MKKAAVAATLVACLAACQSEPPQPEASASMGNATPAPSPASTETASPAGAVHPFAAISEIEASGDLLAVRTGSTLHVGTLDDIVDGTAATHTLDDACGALSPNNGTFVTACGTDIRLFTAKGADSVTLDEPASAAAVTTTGEIIAASGDDSSVRVIRDGDVEDTFTVARETDRVVAAQNGEGSPDSVVRVNNFDTTIQDLDWRAGRQGGTLRAGLGVGKVAAAPQGTILAADTTGSQLLVYNTDDVIRLQMTAPVADSPWAVAWDVPAELAWVASTSTNTAEGYSLATGVPIKTASFPTVADAQSLAALPDGTLVLGSATGEGLQVVAPSQLER
ncbi:hypothetical protein SAMN04488539_0924 [Corynebacterium timonense]|uniref:Prolipoprotein LppL n=1 Tax=Corynebacterium timonense TaxID=441500 RepID=A0A1H1P4J1_9CORY|nr:hypothetical protein SAMN04488539_0924 [Corynebacterium timonense]